MKRFTVCFGTSIYGNFDRRDWAIHCSECCSSFYKTRACVIDNKQGKIISVSIYGL
nr:MAG TPA: hypothetical protein [Caudoviricetes sp.]